MATKRVCDMTPEEHELHLQKRRQYYQNNKDKFKQYSRKYLQKNRDNHNKRVKEYQHERYQQDKQFREKLLDANRKCRQQRGPEYMKTYIKEYRRNNAQYRQSESLRCKQRRLNKIEQGLIKHRPGVYMIKCSENNKVYLGYSTNTYKLKNTPISQVLDEFPKYSDIYKDCCKYTSQAFELNIIWISEMISKQEMLFISKLYFSFYYKLYNTEYNYIDFDTVKRRYGQIMRGKNGGKSK